MPLRIPVEHFYIVPIVKSLSLQNEYSFAYILCFIDDFTIKCLSSTFSQKHKELLFSVITDQRGMLRDLIVSSFGK